jgi:hypothetical protein
MMDQSVADTASIPELEQVLSFAAAPVPASVDTASVGGMLQVDYDAVMGDEGAHLKREVESALLDRPQKKMAPAKQGPLQMLMAAQPQVWDKEQREVETQKAPPDAFNTSAFGTIEGEEEEDPDL